MSISQKCQYSLRALFELACRYYENEPAKIADIAKAQAIPARFLENILSQLKQGSFVKSKRGARGGYFLASPPSSISSGNIIRFIDGPLHPVDCFSNLKTNPCKLKGSCVFSPIWKRAQQAVENIYDNTTLQDLINKEQNGDDKVINYTI